LRWRPRTDHVAAPDHATALRLILDAMAGEDIGIDRITAVGHRVVHGGNRLDQTTRVADWVIDLIADYSDLAPLHNPANLAGIRAVAQAAPDLPQFVCFDTAFHLTNSPVATTYALPGNRHLASRRRYGFHGISYAGLTRALVPLPARVLAFHLGNGASACAIREGQSVATTMGYSPVDGLVMGTRPGSIDPMLVLDLARQHGIDGAQRMLNRDSGLRALAGTSDMADIMSRHDSDADFAVDHFCHWAARQAASLIPPMGGVDAIAFTGGIGENAAQIRGRIVDLLAFLGPVPVHVIRADEERTIAAEVRRMMESGQ
jgi:acetate kinase